MILLEYLTITMLIELLCSVDVSTETEMQILQLLQAVAKSVNFKQIPPAKYNVSALISDYATLLAFHKEPPLLLICDPCFSGRGAILIFIHQRRDRRHPNYLSA